MRIRDDFWVQHHVLNDSAQIREWLLLELVLINVRLFILFIFFNDFDGRWCNIQRAGRDRIAVVADEHVAVELRRLVVNQLHLTRYLVCVQIHFDKLINILKILQILSIRAL